TIDRYRPTPLVLGSAALPMATPVKTLDALHLASALLWRERRSAGSEAERPISLSGGHAAAGSPAGRRGRAPLRTRDQRAQLGLLDHVARAAELADDLGAALVGEHVEQ